MYNPLDEVPFLASNGIITALSGLDICKAMNELPGCFSLHMLFCSKQQLTFLWDRLWQEGKDLAAFYCQTIHLHSGGDERQPTAACVGL